MAKNSLSKKIRTILYCVLSFVLSFVLFFLSLSTVFQFTLLNSEFIYGSMNSTSYFLDKRDEVTKSLINLGNASGFDKEFFDGLVDELMVNEDTHSYLKAYYSGEKQHLDTTNFKRVLNDAIDEYVEEKHIENINRKNIDYFVSKAALIYRDTLEIPLYAELYVYIKSIVKIMPYVLIGLVVFAVIICLVFVLTNKWKHRVLKFICYATSGAFLSVALIPTVILLSGKIKQINLTSRALYDLFVLIGNELCITLLVCALLFLVVSVVLYFSHTKMRKKAKEN